MIPGLLLVHEPSLSCGLGALSCSMLHREGRAKARTAAGAKDTRGSGSPVCACRLDRVCSGSTRTCRSPAGWTKGRRCPSREPGQRPARPRLAEGPPRRPGLAARLVPKRLQPLRAAAAASRERAQPSRASERAGGAGRPPRPRTPHLRLLRKACSLVPPRADWLAPHCGAPIGRWRRHSDAPRPLPSIPLGRPGSRPRQLRRAGGSVRREGG